MLEVRGAAARELGHLTAFASTTKLESCDAHESLYQVGSRLVVARAVDNGLRVRQDPFGNYVVQYVLELGHPEATAAIMRQLCGHYADLAQQKFSSNVVEKCLKLGGSGLAELRERVIRELLSSPLLHRLLQVCADGDPSALARFPAITEACVSVAAATRSASSWAGSGLAKLHECVVCERLSSPLLHRLQQVRALLLQG